MDNTPRDGGQLLVQSLIALGATKAFGVPGESYLAVLDALHDTVGRLDYVLCRNEGGAAFMAAAWGKLIRKPGLCFVTRGPGASNAMIGVHTAMQDSVPMILFVGQVGTDTRGREAFQEFDYRAIFGTVAKWAVEIDDVDRLPELLARAWTLATTGRPGPVVVALPENMLTARPTVPPLTRMAPIYPAAPSDAAMIEAQGLLHSAKRPVILLGGTNWTRAGQMALQGFAEASAIPVVAAFRFQDQYDNHSLSYVGEAGVGMPGHVRTLIREADVVLAINLRFGEMTTEGFTLLSVPVPEQKLIHVHPSGAEIGKIYQPTLGITADPGEFAVRLKPVQGAWGGWCERARAAYEASFELGDLPSPVDMGRVMAWLGGELPRDVILTHGAGNFTMWPDKFYRFGPESRLLGPQSGAMGYGLPAAIAACLAHPGRRVVCFAGDGDFQMNCQELATARQHGAAPIVLILNNGIYGTIRAHQEREYPGRVSGTTMENPDFVALARAYGFHAERVERTADFAAAWGRAIAAGTGAVLDLAISAEAIAPRATLSGIRKAAMSS